MPFFWRVLLVLVFIGAFVSSGLADLTDVSYGDHARHRLDVYQPQNPKNAPVLFMVHGGAWKMGDKAGQSVVRNKIKRWVADGYLLVSVNYRLMPDADPLQQCEDVTRALAFAQKRAPVWGGDPSKFILMGHSAGAHLVSLLSARPALAAQNGVQPWLGTVAIDSAVYDVNAFMAAGHDRRFHRQAFGKNPTFWKRTSPYHALKQKIPPFLAICSTQRSDGSCEQAQAFTQKTQSLGGVAQPLPVDLSHRQTNVELGKRNAYTQRVDTFIKSLYKQ